MNAVLEIADLHVEMRGGGSQPQPVLRGVDFALAPGQVHGLVGASGAGKTMVARATLGILPRAASVTAGRVLFAGQDLLGLSEAARRRLLGRSMALIPQDPMTALNPVHRIERHLTDGLRLHIGVDRRIARARALELLRQVHIRAPERVLRQYPHELSGGMRQRVLIAAAFACRPRLIVADEPTTALDVTVQRQILRLIRALQRDAGSAVMFITHDLGVVAKICGHVSVIHAGRIVESAPAAQLFAAPRHPYTRALLAATPRYDRPGDHLAPIPDALSRRLWADAAAYDAARL